ncbi:DMT family transporter [Aquibacillus sp. 3ASR75-11]|uniref:DMT family transporter n=1 Tax=Terrihalobacillus insolitus TaxID=2950438 RepID=A0A9X4AKX6_9BACI|nr:EamA family transporter [Terrihalobacillus insolitus]MDC3412751.1 DMT family transporter [Terrihalobacillus insolitus]MDC3423772.1 DMT family transporter [Terrihalobacillus insolitus]
MKRAYIFILIGASLWGTISWFVKHLYALGFTPMEVVTLRVWTTAIVLVLFYSITSPNTLKLKSIKDIRYFLGTGIISIVFFNFCLFTAIQLSTVPVATALLYTAPAFVSIFSYFLFGESFTKNKVIALIATLVGTSFIVGLFPVSEQSLGVSTILIGLGSGLGYALYSVFSKYALKKYSSNSVTVHTFIVSSIFLTPFFSFGDKGTSIMDPMVLFYAFGLGLFPTAIAYLIYTNGLHFVEASRASILTTVEPVVASIIGVFVFQESFGLFQAIGMVLILSAVYLVQAKQKDKAIDYAEMRENG